MPISIFDLYCPERTLSYFKIFNWSLVIKGLGNFSKKKAINFAICIGKGINNLFLLIEINNFCKISLNESSSGPTHSIISEQIFLSIAF